MHINSSNKHCNVFLFYREPYLKGVRSSRLIFNYLYALVIALCSPSAFAVTPDEEENLFKAAFIYNFAKFTTWPADTWTNNDSSLNLCIIGHDVLVNELEKLNGKKVLTRTLSTTRFSNSLPSGTCHLIYIALSEKKKINTHISKLATQPSLTIAEIPGFAESGGMIELYRNEGKTRLNINLKKVRESGLSISSRLLIIARVIQ